GPLALAPGDVADLAATEGGFGGSIATPNGDEQFILVVASTAFDTSGKELAWSLDTSAAPEGAAAALATGCALPEAPWSTTAVPAETPPTGATTVVAGTKRTVHAPLPNGS